MESSSPGVAFLPAIGMLFNLPLGYSIQISLLVCSILGGIGWLHLFKLVKINKSIIFLTAIMLGLKTGPACSLFGTANIILYAIVPWFILYILKFGWNIKRSKTSFGNYAIITVFHFLLGCFAWIKLSGIIVAGTIGASLYFILLKQMNNSNKIKFTLLYGVLGISFWFPFLLLEKTNVLLTGISANDLYSNIVNYEIESRLFGHNWCESTQNIWLLWSFMAAIGYALPIKVISHGLRDFSIQFEEFTTWTIQNSINEHVLLCGLIGMIFSFITIFKFKASSYKMDLKHRVLMICFLFYHLLDLQFCHSNMNGTTFYIMSIHLNFGSYFVYLYLLPFVTKKKTRLSTIISLGIILALPITETLTKIIQKYYSKKYTYLSTTENDRGLSGSRFSQAIDYIENDSTNDLDVIYFLPSGNMGDLLLRTKMRTMATHFAGTNFHKLPTFKTNQELNIYLVYNENLLDVPEFIQAINDKFLKLPFRKEVLKGSIIVKKLSTSESFSFMNKLSVIIPAKNEADNLKECISEISKELTFHSIDFEILIIDDGSEDKTVDVVKAINQSISC